MRLVKPSHQGVEGPWDAPAPPDGSCGRNRVLFHRVGDTLNYLDIKTVVVSCGTCMDQLQKYEFEKIFPGCRLLDIHEYLMEKDVKLEGVHGGATCTTTPAIRR